MGTVSVPIDSLLPADSPRLGGQDEEHVRGLARADRALAPILVHRPTMRVVDGMHRLLAARQREETSIEVQFVDGTPEHAFVVAVETNVKRGLPLTRADREAAARRVIAAYPHWSDRAIAARTGLVASTVRGIRQSSTVSNERLNARIGLDGRTRPLDGVAGRLRASEALAARPDASLRALAREAGISLGTARDVRQRVERGQDPVPAGLRPGKPRAADELPPAQATAQPVVDADRAELAMRWRSLTADPSLRLSESGRFLLRWLGFQALGTEELDRLVEAVPGHSRETVRRFALRCAESWQRVADQLEARERLSA